MCRVLYIFAFSVCNRLLLVLWSPTQFFQFFFIYFPPSPSYLPLGGIIVDMGLVQLTTTNKSVALVSL